MSSSSKPSVFWASTSFFAAFYEVQTEESFLEGLTQDVVAERVAETLFPPANGSPVPPTEVLHKKAVVLAPGYFGHTDPVHSHVLYDYWLRQFKSFRGTSAKQNRRPLVFFA